VTPTGLVVLKFGGTSVASASRRREVIERVRESLSEGGKVVAVVSAMGRAGEPYATDTLLELLPTSYQHASREADALCATGEEISAAVLAAELSAAGLAAASIRGWQAGIVTDGNHGNAVIRDIRPARLLEKLIEYDVVVVTGFQGVSDSGEITTLGRGGSDTTAIALGAALAAQRVEIFTDVEGVLTADPKIVPNAELITEITYNEAAELAQHGAVILHPRAAEAAGLARIDVYIRHCFSALPGTRLVADEDHYPANCPLSEQATAVTSASGIARFSGSAGSDPSPGHLAALFGAIAGEEISLDMINVSLGQFAFTVELEKVDAVWAILDRLGIATRLSREIAKVTLVGGGIHGIPGIMHRIVRALAGEGIEILQSVDSNRIISVLVKARKEKEAVRALHREFFPDVNCPEI
jgi:aspartate kinase